MTVLRRRRSSTIVAGDPNFIRMWNDMGAMERFDRRRGWWAEHEPQFFLALS